jgi:hypothetical protein
MKTIIPWIVVVLGFFIVVSTVALQRQQKTNNALELRIITTEHRSRTLQRRHKDLKEDIESMRIVTGSVLRDLEYLGQDVENIGWRQRYPNARNVGPVCIHGDDL